MKERYGTDNPLKNADIKAKVENTNLQKYGVKNVLQKGPIRENFIDKALKTKVDNNTIIASKPQRYLCNLFNAECNVVKNHYVLDGVFEQDKIYFEYNGGGHKINVKMGQLTLEEFETKERKRYFALKKLGYKTFIIVNENNHDKLPSDDMLLSMKEYAFNLLKNSDNNYVKFDLDNNLILLKNESFYHDFSTEKILKLIK